MRSFFLSLLFFSFALRTMGADRIESILVRGNEKTVSSVIESISGLKINQEITEAGIEEAKGRIQTSSIFETVAVEVHPGTDASHKKILIRVKEKMTWFVFPSFTYSEGSVSGGATYGEGNLFGRLKKVFVFGDYGPDVRRFFLSAIEIRIFFQSRFVLAVDAIIRRDTMKEFDDRTEVRRVRLLETGGTFLPGYKWSDSFTTSVGAYVRHVDHTLLKANPGLRSIDIRKGNDISFLFTFDYDHTTEVEGLINGEAITFESQLSDNRFYSDFNYFREILRVTKGFLLFGKQVNPVSRASIQLGRTLPYYYELMLGGGNLRGYLDRQFRGDTKYTFSEEILFPIHNFSRFIIRGATFWDTGVLYFKDQEFNRSAWNNGVGAGLRLYLKGIAVPLIGYDVAWAIEDATFGTYLNIGVNF